MTHAPTVGQILSDNDAGLLPYLRHQLQKEEFSHFRAQLGFHVDDQRLKERSATWKKYRITAAIFQVLKFSANLL
jgi:hypothetical protein